MSTPFANETIWWNRAVCFFLVSISASLLPGQPALAGASFFGGAGNQGGRSITISNNALYVGTDSGQLIQYAIPPNSPVAGASVNGLVLYGLAVSGNVAYAAGSAVPPACGASDTAGSVEAKTLFARYNAISGALLGCQSANFFPYTGGESYAALVNDGSFLYATGAGETCGFGNNTFLLSKFSFSGTLLNTVGEPGTNFGGPVCNGGSSAAGLALLNGNLYVAGYSKLTGEDGVLRPVLMKYDSALTRQWKQRPTDNQGGYFNGAVAFGGAVYAVGVATVSGKSRFLIEKYDEAGNRIWSQTSAGPGDDVFNAAIGIGTRLFAVGSTTSQGAGGADAAILEIDPLTGNTVSTTLWGGAQDDMAYAAATDGTNLYVTGSSKSFASGDGNQIGQDDVILLQYSLQSPALTIAKSHSGSFLQGQNGVVYSLVVNNGANAGPTIGTVTVTENVPAGLTLVSMAGAGWNCPSDSASCTRSDVLTAGSSYPAIGVTANVTADAAESLTNRAGVAGGGAMPASIGDVTAIAAITICDLNRDGNSNVSDVQLVVNAALAGNPRGYDLNNDGLANVVDVQIVINAALGLGCSGLPAPPPGMPQTAHLPA